MYPSHGGSHSLPCMTGNHARSDRKEGIPNPTLHGVPAREEVHMDERAQGMMQERLQGM
jgi:hypothetical protein